MAKVQLYAAKARKLLSTCLARQTNLTYGRRQAGPMHRRRIATIKRTDKLHLPLATAMEFCVSAEDEAAVTATLRLLLRNRGYDYARGK
jgi:hypothetical protein